MNLKGFHLHMYMCISKGGHRKTEGFETNNL